MPEGDIDPLPEGDLHLGYWKRNVLYDRDNGTVTLIDFETTAPLRPGGSSVEGPELYRIFGAEFRTS